MKTQQTYYIEGPNERIPINPTLVKIARLIARRQGEDWRDVLTAYLHRVVNRAMEPAETARIDAKIQADWNYCIAEGLDYETFCNARHDANLKRWYRELRAR